jgi:hypothetical protein
MKSYTVEWKTPKGRVLDMQGPIKTALGLAVQARFLGVGTASTG